MMVVELETRRHGALQSGRGKLGGPDRTEADGDSRQAMRHIDELTPRRRPNIDQASTECSNLNPPLVNI